MANTTRFVCYIKVWGVGNAGVPLKIVHSTSLARPVNALGSLYKSKTFSGCLCKWSIPKTLVCYAAGSLFLKSPVNVSTSLKMTYSTCYDLNDSIVDSTRVICELYWIPTFKHLYSHILGTLFGLQKSFHYFTKMTRAQSLFKAHISLGDLPLFTPVNRGIFITTPCRYGWSCIRFDGFVSTCVRSLLWCFRAVHERGIVSVIFFILTTEIARF